MILRIYGLIKKLHTPMFKIRIQALRGLLRLHVKRGLTLPITSLAQNRIHSHKACLLDHRPHRRTTTHWLGLFDITDAFERTAARMCYFHQPVHVIKRGHTHFIHHNNIAMR